MARSFKEFAAEQKATWDEDTKSVYEAASQAFEYEMAERARLGALLKSFRERRSLSQPALAAMADVQQAEISRIERGASNPTESTIIRLAKALDVRLTIEDAIPA
ncbi:helix-turn-helix domain-containing protein [Microbacterium paludicola]|uniref:helix-turn-helix domain-containing protein n=1 Tax=Microbacterium paludicola TaxID=300019 RepID=UPI0011A059DB|nr:helix-turn-helix transcriptional regulator [Microbacterium paludicola]